jgi:hypothetical protein
MGKMGGRMHNGLYFLIPISKSIGQRISPNSLDEALETICRLGQIPGYEDGWRQFVAFAGEIANRRSIAQSPSTTLENDRAFLHEKAARWNKFEDTTKPESASLIRGAQVIADDEIYYRELYGELYPTYPLDRFEFRFQRDAESIDRFYLSKTEPRFTIRHIVPGHCSLYLSTGRLIWRDSLMASELFLGLARPGRPVKLAAQSPDSPLPEPTRTLSIYDGEVVLEVFPGIEFGHIEIALQPPHESKKDL